MTSAPSGTRSPASTLTIFPPETTSTPFSMGGPEIGRSRAPTKARVTLVGSGAGRPASCTVLEAAEAARVSKKGISMGSLVRALRGRLLNALDGVAHELLDDRVLVLYLAQAGQETAGVLADVAEGLDRNHTSVH